MTEKLLRNLMLFWCFFIGIGALIGAGLMFYAPSGSLLGMEGMLPFFQKLPFAEIFFQSFFFPGIALLCCNGITQLGTAVILLLRKPYGSLCGMACGIILILWICIQFYVFPMNVMSTLFFIFGVLQLATGILLYRKERNE